MYSIITNNCYGTQYYHTKNIKYNTCFVGLFLYAPCYINFLENFDDYIKRKRLLEINKSKYGNFTYPIGRIGNSEIHFLHEENFNEAKDKWNRRKKRLSPLKECIIKMCDRDLFNEEILKRFINLEHPFKILFLSKKYNFKIKCKKNKKNNLNIIKTNYLEECPDGYALYNDYPISNYISV